MWLVLQGSNPEHLAALGKLFQNPQQAHGALNPNTHTHSPPVGAKARPIVFTLSFVFMPSGESHWLDCHHPQGEQLSDLLCQKQSLGYFMPSSPYLTILDYAFSSPFDRGRNRGSEACSRLPKVTRVGVVGLRCKPRSEPLRRSLCSSPGRPSNNNQWGGPDEVSDVASEPSKPAAQRLLLLWGVRQG